MLKKLSLAMVCLIASTNGYAISTTTPSKVSDGVALDRIQAYTASSTKSKKIGIVEPGTSLLEHKNFLKTKPGLAIMEEKPKTHAIPFDRGASVYIWEYLEGGFSKIIINNIPYTAKIARSKTECDRFPPSPKYCWARVISEPEYYEWKQVSLKEDSQKFWILNRIIDGSGTIAVKDEAIVKTRLIQTKRKQVEAASDLDKKEDKEESVEVTQQNDLLYSEQSIDESKLPKDPIERQFVLDMLKPKSVRDAEKAEKLKQEKLQKEEKAKQEKQARTVQQLNFKDNNLNNSSLNANLDSKNVTQNTIESVNQDLAAPATKLELKANQPLTLPVN